MSVSCDRTVKIWDVGLGTVLRMLKGHIDLINAVKFSLDGKILVSASSDETIKL